MIELGTIAKRDFVWTCKHFHNQFARNQATNAIQHVLKKKGKTIKPSPANILIIYIHRY